MTIPPSSFAPGAILPSRLRRRLRAWLTGLWLPVISSCQTWQRQPIPGPEAKIAYPNPVRVTVVSGAVLTVCSAALTADSLVAGPCGTTTVADSVGRVAAARGDIRQIEELRYRDRRTFGLVVGSLLAVAAVVAAYVRITLSTMFSGE